MTDHWNRALRSAFSPARELEPTDAEVQRVLAIDDERVKRPQRPPALRLAVAACAAIVIASGIYAAPPTRAALDDVYSTISGWVGGDDGQAPGRPLEPSDDAPVWVRDPGGDKRLVAQNGGARLYAVREDDEISFALAGSVGLSDSVNGWRRQLAEHKVVLLGPGAFPDGPFNDRDERPLFGVTARSVTRVQLQYTTGAPTTQDDLHGGFVLLADATRHPRVLVGYDRAGNATERIDVSNLQLRICRDVRGCPPGSLVPRASGG